MKVKNIPLLLASGICGILFGLIGEIFYQKLIELWYRPLVIALYFSAFALILALVIYSFSKFKQKTFSDHLLRDVCLTLVILFCSSMLLEIFYELGGKVAYNEPTSYIFLIDDSGSMSSNDPNAERIKAISTVMSDKSADFNYAVYVFSNDCRILREMAPKSHGMNGLELNSSGGTAISATIRRVTSDIESGILKGGMYPKILLLSDGISGDSFFGTTSIRKELKALQKRGITVSTVGLGNSVDSSFMKSIAKKTGGVYINVKDISALSTAMKEAMASNAERDLLGVRPYCKLDGLYTFLRILFVFIIATLIMVAKCLTCGGSDFNKVLTVGCILNFLAALVLELGINYIGTSSLLTHVIMCVLISLIMNYYIVRTPFSFSDAATTFTSSHQGGDTIDGGQRRSREDLAQGLD